MATSEPPSPLRRWGPLGIVLVALLAVSVLVLSTAPEGDEEASGATTGPPTTEASELPDGVVPFFLAEELGTVDEIDWGPRCDTGTGYLALPLSPPPDCFAPFEGDNGGATSTGVTADAVTVVVYLPQPNDPVLSFIYDQIGLTDTNEQVFATYEGYARMYEQYYETYGRRIELVPYTATGSATDPVAATADAETIARDLQPFMVFGGPAFGTAFADTLAANEVMCVACNQAAEAQFYIDRAPYVWAIGPNTDQNSMQASEYVGKRLAGRTASHGGPAVADRERTFGYIYLSSNPEAEEQRARFEEQLAEYGVELADVASYTDPVSLTGQAREILARMKDRGVTTILFTGDPLAPQSLTETATQQDYEPEWVLAGTALADSTLFGRTYDQSQWQHAFGPSSLFARVSPQVAGSAYLYEWFWGEPPPARQSALVSPSLQFLMGVMQGVGPDLTPETFQARIFSSAVISSNVLAPQLSWGNRQFWPFTDYAGIDDQVEIWWDAEAQGPDEVGGEGTGMWAYSQGGKRFLPGQWPEEAPAVFGDDPDPVTLYTELPPGITLPQYDPLPRPSGG
jgi:hypothetical protein